MQTPPEIIIMFFLISFLVYTMPTLLVKFSRTLRGKFLLLVLTVIITIYNKTAGLIMALWFVFLSEFNYEFNSGVVYEGFETTAVYDSVMSDPLAGETKKKSQDQLAVEQALKPTDGNVDVFANI
jgi:hypothetical protein